MKNVTYDKAADAAYFRFKDTKVVDSDTIFLKKGDNFMSISPERLKEIQNIPDSDIDTSDIPELGERFWQNAQVVKPIPKTAISIRLDNDVLDWFKTQGKGYQTLINAVLRSYFNHQQNR